MTIGRDLLHELGIHLLFSLGVMKWENATVPMRDSSQLSSTEIDAFQARILSIHDPDTTFRLLKSKNHGYQVCSPPAEIHEMVSKSDHLKKQ
jgi:hypothetical protein